MKRKILTILVSILFITIIPSAIGEIANPESDVIVPNLEDEFVWMKGLLLNIQREGNLNTYFAIRHVVLYNIPSEPQREVYWFEWITMRDSAYSGCMYEIGLRL